MVRSACIGPLARLAVLSIAGALLPLCAAAQNEWSAIEPSSSTWTGPAPSLPSLAPTASTKMPVLGLKTAGQPLTNILPQLLKVQPWQFEFQPGQGTAGTRFGLRPGSLGRAFPDLVKTDLRTGVQTVTTAELLPLLLAAIQEQQQQIRSLEQQQQQLVAAYARAYGTALPALGETPPETEPSAVSTTPRRGIGWRLKTRNRPAPAALPAEAPAEVSVNPLESQ